MAERMIRGKLISSYLDFVLFYVVKEIHQNISE